MAMSAWCTFVGYILVMQGVQWFMQLAGVAGFGVANALWMTGVIVLVLAWVSWVVHVTKALRRWWYYKRINMRINRVEWDKAHPVVLGPKQRASVQGPAKDRRFTDDDMAVIATLYMMDNM